jgi:hypothetical protein
LPSNFFTGGVPPKKPKQADSTDAHQQREHNVQSKQQHLNLLDLTVDNKPRRRLNGRQPGISGDFAAK